MLCSFSCVSLFSLFLYGASPDRVCRASAKECRGKMLSIVRAALCHAADNSISIQTAEWIWIIVIIYWNIKLCFSRSSLSLLCGGFFMQDHDEENRLAFSAMRNWKKSLSDSSLAPSTLFSYHPFVPSNDDDNEKPLELLAHSYIFFFHENTGRWNSAPVLLKCPLQIFFRWMNLDFDRSWVFKAINIFSSLQIRQEKPYYVADPEVDSLVSIFLLLSCSGWCE